ncbi:MAG: hypothetical protein A2283_04995 [Lentisphaerae bacterium RIFOXYA12_FULL_48_11]|nr:MAG: hypothetical protein A2283_04995 [Lentisphaerae bacterium RIFOXYA12_FULL_48_11]
MKTLIVCGLFTFCVLCLGLQLLAQSTSLQPPISAFNELGEPIASMKTIDQVEPRRPIYELPYQITNEGAYYLLNSMQGLATNDGIVIKSSNVELDMRGFGLFGVSNSFSGVKIEVPLGQTEVHNITILNGVIGKWGGYGINGSNAFDSETSRIKVFENGGGGIVLGPRATIRECNVDQSRGGGIDVRDGSRITGCRIFGNLGTGIKASVGSKIYSCLTVENGGDGIYAGDFATVRECQSAGNHSNGIVVGHSCQVFENICTMNGMTNSSGAGILIYGNSCRIENNNLNVNYCGIYLTNGANRIDNNHVMGNIYGIKDEGQGNFIVRNSVGNSSISNYVVTSESICSERFLNPPSGFSISNPWANFEFGP